MWFHLEEKEELQRICCLRRAGWTVVPRGSGLRGLSGARGPLAPGPTLGVLLEICPHIHAAKCGHCYPPHPTAHLHPLLERTVLQSPLAISMHFGQDRDPWGPDTTQESELPENRPLWGLIAGTPWPITLLLYYRYSEVEARLDQADIVSGCLSSWNRKRPAGAACSRCPAAPSLLRLRTRSALFFLDPLFLPGCHSSLFCCLS